MRPRVRWRPGFSTSGREEQRDQIARRPNDERLTLGVAEAAVELDDLRPLGRQHEAREEDAPVGGALAGQRGEGRPHDPFHDPLLECVVEYGHRRVASHAAGIGPTITIEDGFVVLGGGEWHRIVTVREDEEGHLLPHHELLDDHPSPRGAKGSVLHAFGDRRVGLLERAADDGALAGSKAVGLDHERGAHVAAVSARMGGFVEGRELCRRDAVAQHQVLREYLGPFDRRRPRARPEDSEAGGGEPIGEPGDERHFRPDHSEVDALAPGERDELVMRVHADVDARRVACNPGIAWGREHRVDQRALGNFPGQRVLSTPAAHQ